MCCMSVVAFIFTCDFGPSSDMTRKKSSASSIWHNSNVRSFGMEKRPVANCLDTSGPRAKGGKTISSICFTDREIHK